MTESECELVREVRVTTPVSGTSPYVFLRSREPPSENIVGDGVVQKSWCWDLSDFWSGGTDTPTGTHPSPGPTGTTSGRTQKPNVTHHYGRDRDRFRDTLYRNLDDDRHRWGTLFVSPLRLSQGTSNSGSRVTVPDLNTGEKTIRLNPTEKQ